MRTGGYTIHQSLSAEAASLVKQAVSLARRRGHAQVTPLHVASAMLASSTGLFRKACLQAHSHPLQCKALELCFNVALNRLPTSTSSPILGHHSHLPSLSNALVAAFKRAQAHQRRGSIENHQQPILALKVEIEQLVISILDDPSVSRVMREAGFSSTQVKSNVEQAVSLDVCSRSTPAVSTQSNETKPLVLLGNSMSQITPTSQFKLSSNKTTDEVQNDDVMSIIDAMMNKRKKNTVILAEYPATAECVLRGVIEKFNKGDIPSGDMKYVQFISVPLHTLRNTTREEFEQKLGELRSLVKGYMNRGVVLYLGDLQWVSEFWSRNNHELKSSYYSPVERMIMELSRLSSGVGDSGKLWLMGIATFKTFSRCKSGHPSLETLWNLHPLPVPVGSLALSLNLESDVHRSKAASEDQTSWLLSKAGVEKHLRCCADCLANFNKEARNITSTFNSESITIYSGSSLPSWLQKYKEEHRSQTTNDQDQCNKLKDLCRKWNSICGSVHKRPHFLEKAFNFSSPSPSSSTSISSNDQETSKLHKSLSKLPVMFETNNKSIKEHQFFRCEKEDEVFESKLTTLMQATKPDLLSNPNSSPNSASSSEASGDLLGCLNRFKELNSENQKILCSALEKKVPWQREIIPLIVSTVLHCRSGKMMSKGNAIREQQKEEAWLIFSGNDSEGKEKIAMELARVVFGTEDSYVATGLSSFSSTRADSSTEGDVSNKRARNEKGRSYLERFADAVRENPSRVFFMEDVDQVDDHSQKGIKKAIENGGFVSPDREFVPLKDAIVIFCCDSFGSRFSRACSPPNGEKHGDKEMKEEEENGDHLEEKKPCTSLDLNISIGGDADESSVAENGILDLVDTQIIFKIQVL